MKFETKHGIKDEVYFLGAREKASEYLCQACEGEKPGDERFECKVCRGEGIQKAFATEWIVLGPSKIGKIEVAYGPGVETGDPTDFLFKYIVLFEKRNSYTGELEFREKELYDHSVYSTYEEALEVAKIKNSCDYGETCKKLKESVEANT